MPFSTVAEMARLMHCTSNSHHIVKDVCIDSRLLKAGDVYFALPGDKVDGHSFIQEVAEKGASAAVVLTSYSGPDFGLPLIRSRDVLVSLQLLAKVVHQMRKPRVVAVTGSIGKTTTKEFIATLLRQKYRVGCSPGNSNSQVGLPLTILNHAKADDEVLVLEMGMTHPGNILSLLKIVPPEIAVITTVQLVHAVNFDSINDIARAKAEIFTHPETKIGILNHDIPIFDQIRDVGHCVKQSFSVTNKNADYFLQADGEELTIDFHNHTTKLGKLNVPGDHFRMNFLAAAAVARSLDMSWDEIRKGMSHLELPERRMQLVEKNGILFVNDSYNAAELSLKAALKCIPEPKSGGRKIGVIGEMFELGKFSEGCHKAVGEFALKHVDRLICMGKGCQPIVDLWKNQGKPVEFHLQRQEVVAALKQEAKPGDVVLLKGSRGNQLWKVLEEF